MAPKASQIITVDLTAVAVADFSSTVNAEIEVQEAGDWVLVSSEFVHTVDQADGSPRFIWSGTFQKHEVV